MKNGHLLVGSALLIASSVLVGRFGAVAQPGRGDQGGLAGVIGPDVIVGALPGISKYGTVGGISAYALGTTSCNIGDTILWWCDVNKTYCDDTEHPVIGQNLYRLKNGRFEQLGISWLKHGFCALAETLCGACTFDPYGCDALGIGCSDPYDSTLNGQQSGLGPRSQVNAATGIFPYPFSAPAAPPTIGRRLQVAIDDLNPALNTGALYFGEGHYVTADDAAAGNDDNNMSYRRVTVGSLTSGSYTLSFTGSTIQQKAALYAWQTHGLGLNQPDPNVFIQTIDVADDGRFIVAYKVTDNFDGTWHYEYSVLNQNSDRAGQSWHIPIGKNVTVTNISERIVNHHSGEPYSTAPWAMTLAGDAPGEGVLWKSQTITENPNANALRWGVMFNFRFDANTPPVAGTATLGLFKPGADNDETLGVLVPFDPPPPCPADLNGDGTVDGGDYGILLGEWGTDGASDLNGDGLVDGADAGLLAAAWGDC